MCDTTLPQFNSPFCLKCASSAFVFVLNFLVSTKGVLQTVPKIASGL